jgi:hypothetical protein
VEEYMGDVLICPRCGFRSEGADPMTRTLPSCADPHCALDRVDGRPVGPAQTTEERALDEWAGRLAADLVAAGESESS